MIERALEWISDRWLSLLAVLVVVVGFLLGRRAEKKSEAAAKKIAKAGRTIERARSHNDRADAILSERKDQRRDDEIDTENEDPDAPDTVRARIARINERLRDAGGD